MNVFLLYIDPGTGSMLFSVCIGVAATLFFLARALWLKLQLFFTGGKAKADTNTKKYVIYNEGRQYLNCFKPVLDAFEKRGTEVFYLTSMENDPLLNEPYKFVKGEYIGEGNKAFARLNMLSAGVVLMTTPGLDVYQMKRSKTVKHYAHLRHGSGDATMYRLYGIDYFDSVLLTGDYQKDDLRYLEKSRGLKEKELVTVGCTYLDELKKKMEQIPAEENHAFTVLLCPSWGPSAILSKYGEKLLTPLIETGWHIIVRPHPQSKKSESEMLERLQKKYESFPNIEWNFDRDNIYALKRADIMISDFSSVIYDYTFLCDKPVMYVNADLDLRIYDASEVYDEDGSNKRIWQFTTLEKIGIELKEEQFTDIKNVIQNASDSPVLAAARAKAKSEAWMHIGEAGDRVCQFMIDKVEEKQ
ncbi:CDP-glycerol glycerophosphotransferase family protein [Treponema saccharophilum]|uniref:CDP-glycerol:poly(Glycerophosphate) glycerophosphotransferase n=1 Tax=Treponema saccharophilum DSM 2985 TaxID=907348 RepID=H7EMI3_9SPIR|nr:CDP-glycerol glycerophosphotransferase family protein [Treponema saccharophilum]EIC01268.1 CDP-glycerol:poly(glycerophosphate) glycerophosphotransferase [Treponema saccharophilum DSM 2985]BDC96022.1 CDP-glycerol glycerophosphotransferase [Treponema saccharophilum]